MEDSIKITSRCLGWNINIRALPRPLSFSLALSLSKTRLSVRNGFLVSGNYLEISATESPGTCAVGIAACSTPPQSRTFRGLATLHTALTVIRDNYSHGETCIKLRIHPELSRGSVPIYNEIIIKSTKEKKTENICTICSIIYLISVTIFSRRLRSCFFGKNAMNDLRGKDLEN